jgi:hypothetical protein
VEEGSWGGKKGGKKKTFSLGELPENKVLEESLPDFPLEREGWRGRRGERMRKKGVNEWGEYIDTGIIR